jgi:hypothetical protein
MTPEETTMAHGRSSQSFAGSGVAVVATAVGAVAIGALAIGVLAIRRLAIRRVVIDHAEFKSLVIGELTVARLRAGDVTVTDTLTMPDSKPGVIAPATDPP